MATLQLDDGRVITLRARHLVGRSRSCDLRLRERAVSGEHAVVRWHEGAWWVRDLGSSNGTRVDGESVSPGKDAILERGMQVEFGDVRRGTMRSVEAPAAHAIRLDTDDMVEARDGLLALPSIDDPQAVLVPDTDGAWLAEQDEGSLSVNDLDVIDVGGLIWRVHLPLDIDRTLKAQAAPVLLEEATLRLAVTPDEEEVRAAVSDSRRSIELDPKAHWYTILTLARLRQDEETDGWVDREQLCKMLRINRNGLNVQLYRARHQLMQAGVEGVGRLVERRGGRLRLGLTRVVIETQKD